VYALTQAFRSLRQHLTSSLATFTTALVSFTLLFLLGLVLWNLQKVIATLEREAEISAFLQPSANIEEILSQVQTWAEVDAVKLQTRDEAMALLQLDYPGLSQAQEFVQNPLPDTLRLTLKTPGQVRQVARRLATLPGIGAENVEYGGLLTEQLVQVLGGVRVGANILVLLLMFDTLFSVMGTIRLSIENRREELRVMQLVGATRRFIQGPFILEGLFLTLFSTGLALVLGLITYSFLSGSLQKLLPFVPVLSGNEQWVACGALAFLALVLGAGGAYLSTRANLREVNL
jgi:cell division transport system permease protein